MANEQEKNQKPGDITNLEKRLKVAFSLRDKIDQALNKLYKKGNITHKEVTDYLDNPDNFPKGQWEYIQKRRESLSSFIMDALGPDQKENLKKKEQQKKAKKRKRKSLGFRRKWIQMD